MIDHIHQVAAAGGNLIGWNELGPVALQTAVHQLPGWSTYFPSDVPGAAQNAVAISWKTDIYELLDSGYERVHGGVVKVTPRRYNVWVKLRNLHTGHVFYRINTHVVHHIESGGRARVKGAFLGQNRRAKKHFNMLRALIAKLAALAPVIVGGDFNVDYLAEKRLVATRRTPWFPLTMLSAVATPVMPHTGTHGGRAIDWTLTTGTLTEVSQTVLPHGSSDHNPVLTTFSL